MRDIYKSFLLSVFILLTVTSAAQQSIGGRVVDSAANMALQGANVSLLTAKDSLIDRRSTAADGKFQMKRVPAGQYRLQVNHLGYQSAFIRIIVSAESDSPELAIRLLPEYRTLEEVAII